MAIGRKWGKRKKSEVNDFPRTALSFPNKPPRTPFFFLSGNS